MSQHYGIALGSNLGDRLANLRRARSALASLSGGSFLAGQIYETTPVDCPEDSPDFLNTVLELPISMAARDLLAITQKLERDIGRHRNPVRNAPRPIDIDLLYGERIETEDLVLPHPRMTQRLFVMQPLSDIRQDLRLDDWETSAAEIAARLRMAEGPLRCFASQW